MAEPWRALLNNALIHTVENAKPKKPYRHKTGPQRRRKLSPHNRKLNWAEVRKIRQDYEHGTTRKTLANQYHVSVTTIKNIVTYESWIEQVNHDRTKKHR